MTAGISAPYLVRRFVEPSLAFVSGWSYWYTWSIFIAAEAVAGTILLEYWTTAVPSAVWIVIYLLLILALNIFTVEYFGESEFWFASIKIITIVGLIILGFVIFFGGAPTHDRLGFRYWEAPGAFIPYMASGNWGKCLAYWTATVRAGFAFVTSPELVAQAGGESVAPRHNIPKAARRFIWRLLFFYGFGALIVGVIVPSNDPMLSSGASNAASSPFVIGIQRAGITGLNHVINAAILTSAWSAGNCFLYSGSRILYGMALQSDAPQIFGRTTKQGVPYVAVLATWMVGMLSFLTVSNAGGVVFNWFVNLSTISGFIAWIILSITYLRFRAALQHNGMLGTRPFVARFQPYTTWFILILMIMFAITNGFQVFVKGNWSVADFLAAYITIPIMLALYLGHKIWHRTPWYIKTDEIDVFTGKQELDEQCAIDNDNLVKPEGLLQKMWSWIA